MSTWRPDSDLVRLNAAPAGTWVKMPAHLLTVLRRGLEVGRASGEAININIDMGDAVAAWGFGPESADTDRIGQALAISRRPAHEVRELDPVGYWVRKAAPLTLDSMASPRAMVWLGLPSEKWSFLQQAFEPVDFTLSLVRAP